MNRTSSLMQPLFSRAGVALLSAALGGLCLVVAPGSASRGEPTARVGAGGTAVPAATASCPGWNVSGTWHTLQSNRYHVTWILSQAGTKLTGSATLPPAEAATVGYSKGKVSGSVTGNRLSLTVGWAAPSGVVRGVYVGTIRQGGVDDGIGYNAANPAAKVHWTGTGPTGC